MFVYIKFGSEVTPQPIEFIGEPQIGDTLYHDKMPDYRYVIIKRFWKYAHYQSKASLHLRLSCTLTAEAMKRGEQRIAAQASS